MLALGCRSLERPKQVQTWRFSDLLSLKDIASRTGRGKSADQDSDHSQ